MIPWSTTLDSLRSQIKAGFDSKDSWLLLSALGLAESSLEKAEHEVDLVARYEGDLRGRKITDLGCGTGRHLQACTVRGATVAGVEGSSRLAALAKEAVPSARIEVADFRALHGNADQD